MLGHLGLIALLDLSLSLVAFAAFSWGVFGHFCAPDGNMPSRMRLLSLGNVGCFAILSHSIVSSPSMHLAGIVAAAGLFLSIALFAWAVAATRRSRLHVAFSGARSEAVIAIGPYRYIRHPFYASYMLFWMSGAAATAAILGWIASTTMVIAYCRIAAEEEAQILSSVTGGDYASYMLRAGRFLPRIWCMRDEEA